MTSQRIAKGLYSLFLSALCDGSQDFYLSVMTGMPVTTARSDRERIQHNCNPAGMRESRRGGAMSVNTVRRPGRMDLGELMRMAGMIDMPSPVPSESIALGIEIGRLLERDMASTHVKHALSNISEGKGPNHDVW